VIAAANPLHGLASDAAAVADVVRAVPAALQHFMAERAGSRRTIEIPGSSHAITVSQPEATAQMILEAAAQPVAA
jgi:pimeloyl-ACP methyl ester carboxylesterase